MAAPPVAAAVALSPEAFGAFAGELHGLLGGSNELLSSVLSLLLKSSGGPAAALAAGGSPDGTSSTGASVDWCLCGGVLDAGGPAGVARVLLLQSALQGCGAGPAGAAARARLLAAAPAALAEAPGPVALRLADAVAEALREDEQEAAAWLATLRRAPEPLADEDAADAGADDRAVASTRAFARAAAVLLRRHPAGVLRRDAWAEAARAMQVGEAGERRAVTQQLLPPLVAATEPVEAAERLSGFVGELLDRGSRAEVADALAVAVAFHEPLLEHWRLASLEGDHQALGLRLVKHGLLIGLKENSDLRKQARFLIETSVRKALCTSGADAWLGREAAVRTADVEVAWKAFWELYETLEDFASHILKSSWAGLMAKILKFLGKLAAKADSHSRTWPPAVFAPAWLEVLLVRALTHDNDTVHKFVMGRLITLDQNVVALSERFVLNEMLPRLSHGHEALYPRSDVYQVFEKQTAEFFSSFIHRHPEGPGPAAQRLLLAILSHRAVHHTPLRLVLSVLSEVNAPGALSATEVLAIIEAFFEETLGRMPVSVRHILASLLIRVTVRLCKEDEAADAHIVAVARTAAGIPDAVLEDVLPDLAAFARCLLGDEALRVPCALLRGLAAAAGEHVASAAPAEASGRAASPMAAARMVLGAVRLVWALTREQPEEDAFSSCVWPAVEPTVLELHRRAYLPRRASASALLACAYGAAVLPGAAAALARRPEACSEMLAFIECHANHALSGETADVEEEAPWIWLYALVLEKLWRPGMPHGEAILAGAAEALRRDATVEPTITSSLVVVAAASFVAALAPQVEEPAARASHFLTLRRCQLRKPPAVRDSRFAIVDAAGRNGSWPRNRLEEYEEIHRIGREGLGRVSDWRDAVNVLLLGKWRALAALARAPDLSQALAEHTDLKSLARDLLDELETLQPPAVAFWTVVARRLAYPVWFGESGVSEEEQREMMQRLSTGLHGAIAEGTGDGSAYMGRGVMAELAAALADPQLCAADGRLWPASGPAGPVTRALGGLLSLGTAAVAVSRCVATPVLASLLAGGGGGGGGGGTETPPAGAAAVLADLLLHREATIADGALSHGPDVGAGVLDEQGPGGAAGLAAVVPGAAALRQKFRGTAGLPRILTLASMSTLAERGCNGGSTPPVVTATLRRLAEILRETLENVLNPQTEKVVANRPPTPMPMSAAHRTQLRGWQAMLALGRHADRATAAELLPELFHHLATPHVPDVRDCQELLGCSLCAAYEDLAVEPLLVPALRNFDVPAQVSASLLIMSGYLLHRWAASPGTCDLSRAAALATAIAPYLSHNNAYVRGTAAYGIHELCEGVGPDRLIGEGSALLKDLYAFLAANKECRKMRGRLRPIFANFDPGALGTLPCYVDHSTVLPPSTGAGAGAGGAADEGTGTPPFVFSDGEFQPTNTFLNSLRGEVAHEQEQLYSRNDLTQYPSLSDNWQAVMAAAYAAAAAGADAGAEAAVVAAATAAAEGSAEEPPEAEAMPGIQRKFVPLEKPIPADEEGASCSSRRRLPLIVIASLIDKTPNLAGLCRTCEVFNCEAVCLANTKIIKDQVFQSISVTAEKWLPVREVPRASLKDYLLELRRRGYALVGVEQTHNSVTMDKWQFTPNTAILLGAEKEGIDAHLLPLLDACVEIPQAGQVRSLNVHVSGSLAVWEYTRQHRAALSCASAV